MSTISNYHCSTAIFARACMIPLVCLSIASGSAQSSKMSASDLEVWNDPAFKRQFTLSYMAETEIEPRLTEDERIQMQEIVEHISSDRMNEAAKILAKEIERNKAVSAVFDFTLANIHFQQENLEQAIPAYSAAVEKFPKFRRAWKNLALIHVRQNNFVKAIPALTKVIELGGTDSVTYGLLGFSYSSVENHIAAESAYRMAILLDPATMDWKMGLAKSFFKQERYNEAAAICGNLIESNPERADLWLLQANAYLGLNEPMKAAQVYELVKHTGQSSPDSLNMLGDIYTNQELYGLAVDSYSDALKLASTKPDRALRSAKVLVARGALDETRRLLEQIESHKGTSLSDSEKKDLLKLRARLAVAEGSTGEEVHILEEIVKLDPLDGEALILLGQNCARAGESEKAVFYYERAAALENFESDAKLRHGQLLVSLGRYSEAMPLLNRAQQIKPRENVQKYIEQVERVARGR